MSTLIKGGRRILDNITFLICTLLAGAIVWRAVVFDDLLASWMCIALAFCLFFTGIALIDYRKSLPTSDNGL
jgi:hypothetical protein